MRSVFWSILFISLPLGLFSFSPWGFFAHRKINNIAVFSLPDPLFPFFKKHLNFLSEHAVDPDKRRHAVKGEAPKHYIDLDHFGENIDSLKASFPRTWKNAVTKYSEDTLLAFGIGPWNAMWEYYQLVEAFKEKDQEKLLRQAADLGHYIGDLHVPLHTSENYNGQLTNQKGIHAFWETRLPELYFNAYDMLLPEATYVMDLNSFIWEIVFESHALLPQVFDGEKLCGDSLSDVKYAFEERSKKSAKVYSESYSQCFNDKLNGMVEQRMRDASYNLSCLWFSAWVDAGQPKLSKFK